MQCPYPNLWVNCCDITPEGSLEMVLSIEDSLREKCPNTEFFLVHIFLYSDWMRRFHEYRKIRKKLRILDTFHAVIIFGYQWSISEKILMEMVLSMMLSIEDASLTLLELARAIIHIRFFIMSNTNTNLPVWLSCWFFV